MQQRAKISKGHRQPTPHPPTGLARAPPAGNAARQKHVNFIHSQHGPRLATLPSPAPSPPPSHPHARKHTHAHTHTRSHVRALSNRACSFTCTYARAHAHTQKTVACAHTRTTALDLVTLNEQLERPAQCLIRTASPPPCSRPATDDLIPSAKVPPGSPGADVATLSRRE